MTKYRSLILLVVLISSLVRPLMAHAENQFETELLELENPETTTPAMEKVLRISEENGQSELLEDSVSVNHASTIRESQNPSLKLAPITQESTAKKTRRIRSR